MIIMAVPLQIFANSNTHEKKIQLLTNCHSKCYINELNVKKQKKNLIIEWMKQCNHAYKQIKQTFTFIPIYAEPFVIICGKVFPFVFDFAFILNF